MHAHTYTRLKNVNHSIDLPGRKSQNPQYLNNELVVVYLFGFSLWLHSQNVTHMHSKMHISPTQTRFRIRMCTKQGSQTFNPKVHKMLRRGTVQKMRCYILNFEGSSVIYRRQRDYYWVFFPSQYMGQRNTHINSGIQLI